MWPKRTLLLPAWPKRLDTPAVTHRSFVPTPSLPSTLIRSQRLASVDFILMLYCHMAQQEEMKSSDEDHTRHGPTPSNGG